MAPKKKSVPDDERIVFADLHPADNADDDDDSDPFAPFEEGDDPFAMPEVDDEPAPQTGKKPKIEAVEDDDAEDEDLIGQDDVDDEGDDLDDDDQGDDADDDDADDELGKIKDPALRERILSDRRRLEEQDRQLADARNANIAQAKSLLKTRRETAEGNIKDLKAKLVKAKEDGNSEDEVNHMADLNAAQIDLRDIEHQEKQVETVAAQAPAGAKSDLNPTSDEARRYLDRNAWINDSRFRTERDAMGVIDKGLAAEGYDPATKTYFDELDRRLRYKFPNLPGGDKTVKKEPKKRTRKRSSVAAVDRGSVPKGRSRSGKVILTGEDRANMERFGLDPRDANQVQQYAAEKRAIERQEEQMRKG